MKAKLLSIAILLVSLISPVSSFASSDCPESWQVDTSKYPNNPQLLSAKERLGPNMVETLVGARILNYAGVEGPQIPFKDLLLISGAPRTSLLYLYGKSKVETTIKVEVKGCSNPFIFTFISTYEDRDYPIERMNSGTWASATPTAFTDFKKQESFVQDISVRVQTAQSEIDRFLNRSQSLPLPDFKIFGKFYDLTKSKMDIQIQVLTPECVYFDTRFRNSFVLKTGKVCKFALSIYQKVNPDNPSDQRTKWVILDSFELDFRSKTQTLTCVKGKETKKVTATNPKCPAGYKKK